MGDLQQGPSTFPPEYTGFVKQAWLLAEPLFIAALSAHSAIVVLTEFFSPVPLAVALVATLAFAAITLAFALLRHRSNELMSDAPISIWLRLSAAALAFLGIWVGAALLAVVVNPGTVFYCNPAVPWRIDIPLIGSFASGYLSAMARPKGRAWLVYPLTMVAFLWIAPFYGFFSAPMFLAISVTACPDRDLVATILVAFGMIVGSQVGAALAQRLKFST